MSTKPEFYFVLGGGSPDNSLDVVTRFRSRIADNGGRAYALLLA